MKASIQKRHNPWLELTLAVVINTCIGFAYAWSVFIHPLSNQFGWSLAAISFTFTIILSMSSFLQLIAGKLMQYTSPKVVIFFGGIFAGAGILGLSFMSSVSGMYLAAAAFGLGMALVYPSTVANTVKYFPNNRGMVTGLLAAGMGSGSILWAPLAAKLIDLGDVFFAFRVIGILLLVVICGLSLLMKQIPEEDPAPQLSKGIEEGGGNPIDANEKTWTEMVQSPTFYVLAILFVSGITSGMMVMSQASLVISDTLGYPAIKAAFFVGILSLCNTIGRAFWGMLSDRIGRRRVYLFLFIALLIADLALWRLTNELVFLAALFTVGSCYGGFMGTIGAVTADAFGVKNLGFKFGIMFMTVGIASIIGPLIASTIRSNYGSYAPSFGIAMAMGLLGLLMSAIYAGDKWPRGTGVSKNRV